MTASAGSHNSAAVDPDEWRDGKFSVDVDAASQLPPRGGAELIRGQQTGRDDVSRPRNGPRRNCGGRCADRGIGEHRGPSDIGAATTDLSVDR